MSGQAAKSVLADTEIRALKFPCTQPDWDDLRILATVAREGSFRKAALRLGVQQPTVSRRIESLEKSLGTKLFDRTSRGLVLTFEGRRLANVAESIQMVIDKEVLHARAPERSAEGECKLCMTEGLAMAWFVRFFLKPFSKKYSRLILRLGLVHEMDRNAIPPFDMQLRYAPTNDGDARSLRLGTFHFTYFASTEYVAERGMPKSHNDLSKHLLADVMATLTSASGLLATYSNLEAVGHPALCTNSGHVVAGAVSAGSVIGLLPSYAFLTAPNLVPVLPDYHLDLGIYLNFVDGVEKRPSGRVMIEYLRDTVFSQSAMPWFADEYECPVEDWRVRMDSLVQEALKGQTV